MIKILLLILLLFTPLKVVAQSDNNSDFIKIEALFNERNRLDLKAMMEASGFTDRGQFLSIMADLTGDENWDRNLDRGDIFYLPRSFTIDDEDLKVKPINATVDNLDIEESDVDGAMQMVTLDDHISTSKPPSEQEYFPEFESTYRRVLDQGYVNCGTKEEFPGFSEQKFDDQHGGFKYFGFDVDLCRAVAAAVFGDPDAVEFVVVDGKTRFSFLINGDIDILSAATTYTFSRNVDKKLEFLPTTYYDGQGFITRKTLGVSSAKQMNGARVCFSGSGTAAQNIKDFFEKHMIKYKPVELDELIKPKDAYLERQCDMYGTDRSGLASNRLSFDKPDEHIILPEIISKEPLGPVVKYGDQRWSDIVKWTIYVLFLAEEWGITSKNVDDFFENEDPLIQRLMGERDGDKYNSLGEMLGLDPLWSYYIIKYVGNYEQIYNRNVGPDSPLGLKRGLNKMYTKGGLLYAPPLK